MRYRNFRRIVVVVLLACATSLRAEELCDVLNGAKIVAQDDDNTYLGRISNAYDGESIFNNYGTYGSKYSAESIWNKYGTFGSQYSSYSPFNKYSSEPPLLVKDGEVIGYLSANKSIESSIAPNLLRALCEEEL
jgi:hypothetical protein